MTLKAHLAHVPKRRPIELWFQDEARIGQKNGLVRQWARRGTRPCQPADQRDESAYLFGAICPARGVGAALAMPFADTHAMQDHRDEIARTVARGAHAVLLLAIGVGDQRTCGCDCVDLQARFPTIGIAPIALSEQAPDNKRDEGRDPDGDAHRSPLLPKRG